MNISKEEYSLYRSTALVIMLIGLAGAFLGIYIALLAFGKIVWGLYAAFSAGVFAAFAHGIIKQGRVRSAFNKIGMLQDSKTIEQRIEIVWGNAE